MLGASTKLACFHSGVYGQNGMDRFTLYYGAPPSPSYHGSFHQWFTLCYGAPPSPSYHGSFYQRFIFPHPPPPSATGFGQVVGEQDCSDADGDKLETHLVDDY
ncbi:hypothetical protein Taro_031167 [Colocasia esculenta]|uniref:Uncharacterized protein n=1 Tax=Colocasia esculenta TaxID=4460 RepID=A0A843VI66_COLES|nr:hypothetical protein [Colocasia esculenta]